MPPSLIESLLDFYRTTPVRPGSVDLFAVGEDDSWTRMAEIGALLCLVGQPESPLAHVRVIWSDPVTPELKAAIADHACEVLRKFGVEEPIAVQLLSRLDVEVAASLEMKSLVDLIGRGAPGTAFVVAHAARYRADEVQPTLPEVPMKEDTWVPHLTALMHALGRVAGPAGCYVALDAGEDLPTREENREQLRTAPDSAVFGVERPSPDAKRALFERLVGLTVGGNVGQALEELDATNQFGSVQKLLMRIQLLRRAGLTLAVAAELLSAREHFGELLPEMLLTLAGHAEFTGQRELAADLVAQALPELRAREDLEHALAIASGTGYEDLVDRVETMLAGRFPSSPILARRRALACAANGEFAEAAAVAQSTTAVSDELRAYWSWLGDNLQHDLVGDLQAIRQDADHRFPGFTEETTGHIVRSLLRNEREPDALMMLLGDGDPSTGLSPAEANGVVKALHQIALSHSAAGIPVDVLWISLLKVIRTLASRPGDTGLRFQVVEALAPEQFGAIGLAVVTRILEVLSDPSAGPLRNRPHLLRYRPHPEEPEIDAFLDRAGEWMKRTPRFVLGTRTFPRELLSISADDALAVIGRTVVSAVSAVAMDDDRSALHVGLALAVAIAPLASDTDEDLVILRLAVSMLAAAGLRQDARDLAEQALALSRGDAGRTRMAWTIFAEAYARGSNLAEALVGMACALAVQPAGSWEESWLDSILISRLLRDLKLVELAEPFVKAARDALAHIPDEGGDLASRLETIDLGLALFKYGRDDAWDPDQLESFLGRAADNLRSVLALHDEAGPAASLLANAIHIARVQDVMIPPDAEQVLAAALEVVDPTVRTLISATAARAPSADELFDLALRTQPARYRDDVGFDEDQLAGMARRLLGSEAAVADAVVASYAIEATADHSVTPPGTRGALDGTGPRLTATAHGAADAACEISRGGIDVVLLGNSDTGLRRVVASGGGLQSVAAEPAEVFDVERLKEWLQAFPIAYGKDDADANTFYLSTEGIGVSELPDRAVVIADTELQVFPPGLLRIRDKLAGDTARVAAAPSLEWLLAARRAKRNPSRTRTAWIPHDPDNPDSLARLADRMEVDLTAHGFELTTSIEPPRHPGGAEMAIVVAHGGVADANRYFRVVKNDAGAAVAPGALASAFGDTAIVVLFVCSAGRVDVRPGANAVVGLVRKLLGNGCNAVVAPPWPLETLVPPRWLPPFLDALDRGRNVLDACFEANELVRSELDHEPRRWLAMSVYGDPYTTVSGPEES